MMKVKIVFVGTELYETNVLAKSFALIFKIKNPALMLY